MVDLVIHMEEESNSHWVLVEDNKYVGFIFETLNINNWDMIHVRSYVADNCRTKIRKWLTTNNLKENEII